MRRFLVDEQLPPALAFWLVERGFQAHHVSDLGLGGEPDSRIWAFAVETSAVIITKDEDFPRRRAVSSDGPVIIWIRLGNTRRAILLEWFEAVFPRLLEALELGETLIEVA